MRWLKDPTAEAEMRRKGIAYDAVTVPLAKIDLAEGVRRQVRLINKLDDSALLIMAEEMLKPDAAFPMPILQKPPHNAMLWAWDGNHRLNSFVLAYPDATHVDCYTITISDPVMMDLLPITLNCLQSVIGFGKDERIARALWLVGKHNFTRQEAAAACGIKLNWLHVANQETQTRDAIADIPRAEKISKSTLRILHPIMQKNMNVLRAVVRLFTTHDVKHDDSKAVIADIKNQATEAQMMGEVGKWEKIFEQRKEPKKRAKGTVVMTRDVRDSFLTAFSRVAKILENNDTVEKLQITDPVDLANTLKYWSVIKPVMTNIEKGA